MCVVTTDTCDMFRLFFQVDGDTDSSTVQKEFERIARQQIESLGGSLLQAMNGDVHQVKDATSFTGLYKPNGVHQNDEYLEDLEDDHQMPGAIPTISKQVSNHMSLTNGHVGNSNSAKFNQKRPPGVTNGYIANGKTNFRTMLEDAEMNSHI